MGMCTQQLTRDQQGEVTRVINSLEEISQSRTQKYQEEFENKIYEPSPSDSIVNIKFVLQIKQHQENYTISQNMKIKDLKNDISKTCNDKIKNLVKLDKDLSFQLRYNEIYLQSDKQLADYDLNDTILQLVSVVSIQVKISNNPKEYWIRKMFLSQTWLNLKEKMAKDLSLQTTQIKLRYKNQLTIDHLSLYESKFLDGEEVVIE